MLSGSSSQVGKLSVKIAKRVLSKIVVKSLSIGFWFVLPLHNYWHWIAKQNITILFKRICMTLYHLSPNQSCHFDEVTHSDGCHAWSALISFLPWKHLRTHFDHEWECEREKWEVLRNRSQRTAIAKENLPYFWYLLHSKLWPKSVQAWKTSTIAIKNDND